MSDHTWVIRIISLRANNWDCKRACKTRKQMIIYLFLWLHTTLWTHSVASLTKYVFLKCWSWWLYTSLKYLWFTKNIRKERRRKNLRYRLLLFWPLKLCLLDFAEQSLHCSIILRGKEWRLCNFAGQSTIAPWFCGTKSALLHNFAGQVLHCSKILQGKYISSSLKIQQNLS